MVGSGRQAGTAQSWNGMGVWVPDGLSVDDIMLVAAMLEREFDVSQYLSRAMARAAIKLLRGTGSPDNPQHLG